MGDIVKYKITSIGDLEIEKEYDYEFQYLHLTHLAGNSLDGDLRLYLQGTTINFPCIPVLDALLGIYGGLLNCLANRFDEKQVKVRILDLPTLLQMKLNGYQVELKFDYLSGHCDFRLLYQEVFKAITEIMELMYAERPELAYYEVDHGREFDAIRYNWILGNDTSIEEPLRTKLLKGIGRQH